MSYYSRGDTQIAQAKKMLEVGEKVTALSTLHQALSRRREWNKDLEEAAMIFVKLSVENRKDDLIKECLSQYKLSTQSSAPQSLGDVLEELLKQSTDQYESAKAKATKKIADIRAKSSSSQTTTTFLSGIPDEAITEKINSEIVGPWARFLWNMYRFVLDMTKGNMKLDGIYQKTVNMALDFCKKENRKKELYYLCEQLSYHVQGVILFSGQASTAILQNQEGLHVQLMIRLNALEVALSMGLLADALVFVADFWQLRMASQKVNGPSAVGIRSSVMRKFYELLSRLLWDAKEYGWYSQAQLKLLQLRLLPGKKPPTQEEAGIMISHIVLGAICSSHTAHTEGSRNVVPPFSALNERTSSSTSSSSAFRQGTTAPFADGLNVSVALETEQDKDKVRLMTSILGPTTTMTRAEYISHIKEQNLLSVAPPLIQETFSIFEECLLPRKLSREGAKCLERLGTESDGIFAKYVDRLKEMLRIAVILRCGSVYQSLKIADLCQYTNMSQREIEVLLRWMSDNLGFHFRISHRYSSVQFGWNVFVSAEETAALQAQSASASASASASSSLTSTVSTVSTAPTTIRLGGTSPFSNFLPSLAKRLRGAVLLIDNASCSSDGKSSSSEKSSSASSSEYANAKYLSTYSSADKLRQELFNNAINTQEALQARFAEKIKTENLRVDYRDVTKRKQMIEEEERQRRQEASKKKREEKEAAQIQADREAMEKRYHEDMMRIQRAKDEAAMHNIVIERTLLDRNDAAAIVRFVEQKRQEINRKRLEDDKKARTRMEMHDYRVRAIREEEEQGRRDEMVAIEKERLANYEKIVKDKTELQRKEFENLQKLKQELLPMIPDAEEFIRKIEYNAHRIEQAKKEAEERELEEIRRREEEQREEEERLRREEEERRRQEEEELRRQEEEEEERKRQEMERKMKEEEEQRRLKRENILNNSTSKWAKKKKGLVSSSPDPSPSSSPVESGDDSSEAKATAVPSWKARRMQQSSSPSESSESSNEWGRKAPAVDYEPERSANEWGRRAPAVEYEHERPANEWGRKAPAVDYEPEKSANEWGRKAPAVEYDSEKTESEKHEEAGEKKKVSAWLAKKKGETMEKPNKKEKTKAKKTKKSNDDDDDDGFRVAK
ncbi:Translation initiation factor 3 subunit A [Monocercomonoides exilis]|uniref:Translation initiation factor 3 subunit A n=1 Tax=Monocercomonoides exilis TaxID=2049356 RepID=UPI00355951D7|nr:Translation initiation factor 3 subunit A [Monocercomonoides exilis]|eukprot:MONOS_498.1-p1 / transcript=MONOS_498.1 / gene=MONOS_498 / organism=Monocercomonoides_exilis_PA203 / gene_product=Translation initiation factor 3 subunit A / transcript_product=Translation initiation factor 3 subunit A / location=Mono_scaffold00008:31681-35466(+) / protein_length=1128 / sequence_SO=supercontig / SO=protein_coding / is_pseudo=false